MSPGQQHTILTPTMDMFLYFRRRLRTKFYNEELFSVFRTFSGTFWHNIVLSTTTSIAKLLSNLELTKGTHTSPWRASYGCLSYVIWRKVTGIYRKCTVCDFLALEKAPAYDPADLTTFSKWPPILLANWHQSTMSEKLLTFVVIVVIYLQYSCTQISLVRSYTIAML